MGIKGFGICGLSSTGSVVLIVVMIPILICGVIGFSGPVLIGLGASKILEVTFLYIGIGITVICAPCIVIAIIVVSLVLFTLALALLGAIFGSKTSKKDLLNCMKAMENVVDVMENVADTMENVADIAEGDYGGDGGDGYGGGGYAGGGYTGF